MILLNGKDCAADIKQQLKQQVQEMVAKGHRPPHLTAIIIGNNGASETYVGAKKRACDEIGFAGEVIRLPETVTQVELEDLIKSINTDEGKDGVIVQLPLPKHIDEAYITDCIAPEKDVDGFHTINAGKLSKGMPCYVPATPMGIMMLLKFYNVPTNGKHCVVIGRSNIVGRPASILMSANEAIGNSTVTLCHSRTPDIKKFTLQADIIIAAIGKPEFLTADMVPEGATVIDVGITRIPDTTNEKGYRIAGDVDFKNVAPKCGFITPVPGGVGVMTIAGLLQNTFNAYALKYGSTQSA